MVLELPFSLCCLIVSLLLAKGASDSEADAARLVAFKALADVGGRLESVWNRSASSDCCHWLGVKECRNGRLTKLVVENLGLNGTFAPNTLSRLDQLRVLSLKRNGLTGTIPDLSALHNLKNLFLNYNYFTGSFPISIAGLHRLKVIVLSHNSLAGEIPAALASLPRLSVLSLENNRLSGSLAAFNQSSLRFFNVSDNELSGPVPETLSLSSFNSLSFIGNPGLCGRIVHKPCAALPPVSSPQNQNQVFLPVIEGNRSKHLATRTKIAIIVVGSVVGLSTTLCAVFLFIYRKRHRPRDEQTISVGGKQNSGEVEGEVAGESDAQTSSKSKSKRRSPQSGSGSVSGNLVFCGGESQIYSLEDLLKATAVTLGRGSLGSTYSVAIDSGLTVAVKRVKNSDSMRRGEVGRHIEMLGNLRHPNVVSLRAYFRAKEDSLLVYDYYTNGNLFSLIHGPQSSSSSEARAKPLHWTSCVKIAEDIGQGVAYLHEMGVIHGNLKSSNVLIGSDFEACITDYCLTPFASHPDSDSDSNSNSNSNHDSLLAYRAPECKHTRKMTSMADIYSFGVILVEILSGKTPIQSVMMNTGDLPRWVKSVREGDESADEGSEEKLRVLLNIAMACVSPSPELRPSMRDGVRMITEARESFQSSTSASASDHSPARWSDTIQSLPRDRGTDPSFTERD